MSKTMIINGRIFEVIKPRKNKITLSQAFKMMEFGHTHLGWCYEKPSATKEAIFDDWKKWWYETGYLDFSSTWHTVQSMNIKSYNCMAFSLQAIIKNVECGELYYLVITRDHNKAYLIED